MRHSACLLATFALGLMLISTAHAQEWTRFRGPNGQGVSEAKDIPARWTSTDYNWRVELPGEGHSSPVIWGEKVFLLSATPQTGEHYVLCLNAGDGRTLWEKKYPGRTFRIHARSSFASCTPTVDAERVYVAWATPEETTFKALDHQGNEVWSNNLGPYVGQHGFGTSPILFEDLVILSNSQDDEKVKGDQKPGESRMMAFEAKTGKLRWETPRTAGAVAYSVPMIWTGSDGQPQLVCTNTGDGYYALDPRTGKPLWSHKAFTMRTVSSPVFAGGVMFGSTGSGGGGNYVVALKPGSNSEVAYEVKKSAPYVPCVIAKGDLAFLWSDQGVVTCIDAPTGNVHWSERVRGNYSGSPVIVGDKVYCISDEGIVVVLAASKEFKKLGENDLGEPSRATPAVAGGRMYLRTYSHLISVGGGKL